MDRNKYKFGVNLSPGSHLYALLHHQHNFQCLVVYTGGMPVPINFQCLASPYSTLEVSVTTYSKTLDWWQMSQQ